VYFSHQFQPQTNGGFHLGHQPHSFGQVIVTSASLPTQSQSFTSFPGLPGYSSPHGLLSVRPAYLDAPITPPEKMQVEEEPSPEIGAPSDFDGHFDLGPRFTPSEHAATYGGFDSFVPMHSTDPYAAFSRTYEDRDVVESYGFPDHTTLQRQRALRDALGNHARMVDSEARNDKSPSDLPRELATPLQEEIARHAALHLPRMKLGKIWDAKAASYRGGKGGSDLYGYLRSSPPVTKELKRLQVVDPELHHALMKSRHPAFATASMNLFMLTRGSGSAPGQHDALHDLMSAGLQSGFNFALPSAEAVMDHLIGTGAYQRDPRTGRLVLVPQRLG